MKTYFVVITNDYVKGTPWDINKTGYRRDYVIFDSLVELNMFFIGECAFDAIDNSMRLRAKDEIIATYCILATDYISAINRACELQNRR